MRKTGHYETLAGTEYFIPGFLPPQDPPLLLDQQTMMLYGEAMNHLGKLNEMANRLPDAKRFIKAYVIKEALLSSAIEGVHTTMLDVFTQPLLEFKPNKDTQLVMNYTKALDVALSMIKKKNLPISSRIVLASHKKLMQEGEGDRTDPGNYRKLAVKVGNFVPPPPQHVQKLMKDLERFINEDETFPPLIKAGLAHVQFETIHPFLDGNGRIGRLLIILMFVYNKLLSEPILYPSYYFKKHHLEYYRQLDRVRTHGDFEGWISFYLNAIRDSSIDAYQRAKDIEALEQNLTSLIAKQFDKTRESRLRALSVLFSYPVISVNELARQLEIAYNTSNQIISEIVKVEILVEETGQKRGKLFKFKPYLEILEKELQ